MNLKKLLLVILLCPGIAIVSAQTPKQAKTIYELFHLKPGGCKLSPTSEIDVLEEVSSISIMEEEPVSESEDLIQVMARYKPLFERSPEIISKYQTPQIFTTFKNGNFIYVENNLYGLKNKTGEIIIPSKFHTIIPYDDKGFVGYENQFCNFYSITGQKILKSDYYYYYINPTPKNTFIVRTNKGFGEVSADNKFLISPDAMEIVTESINGKLFYWIDKGDDKKFFLTESLRDTIYLKERGFIKFIDADYWEFLGNLINIKTKKYLVCEPGYTISILNPKYHIASISDKKSNLLYLIDFNGNLISAQPFKSIYTFNNKNIAIASVGNSETKTGIQSDLFGIINPKAAWVVKPNYLKLYFFNDTLLIASDKMNQCGIISVKNKVLVPFKYNSMRKISDNFVIGVIRINGELRSDVIHLPDSKIVKSGLPYEYISETGLCDDSIYIAEGNRKEYVLNKNFEPMVSTGYNRIFYGPDKKSFLGTNFTNGKITESHLFDCNGNMKSFNINGKEYNSFIYYNQVSKDLLHLLINDDSGYFITSEGKTTFNNSRWQNIEYSNAKDFYVTMIFGGKFGLINGGGETVIPPVFEYISPFDKVTGLARYDYDGKQKGLMTSNCELLFGTEYLETQELGSSLFKVMKNGRWGVVNQKGDILIPLQYSSILLQKGVIKVKSGGNYSFFDLKGNSLGQ